MKNKSLCEYCTDAYLVNDERFCDQDPRNYRQPIKELIRVCGTFKASSKFYFEMINHNNRFLKEALPFIESAADMGSIKAINLLKEIRE